MTATIKALSLQGFVEEIEALLDEEVNANAVAEGVRGATAAPARRYPLPPAAISRA